MEPSINNKVIQIATEELRIYWQRERRDPGKSSERCPELLKNREGVLKMQTFRIGMAVFAEKPLRNPSNEKMEEDGY